MIKHLFTTLLILLFLVAGAQTATAVKPDNPGNSGGSTPGEAEASEDPSDDAAFDVFKIQGSKKGLIKVDKESFCTGETFSVRVVFPKSLRPVWNGDADVHLVIRLPDGYLFHAPLIQEGDDPPEQPMNLFEIPLESDTPLPTGTYQFALVLTEPNEMQPPDNGDGDNNPPPDEYESLNPLDVNNWYHGFAGLVSAKAVKISDTCDESPEETTAPEN